MNDEQAARIYLHRFAMWVYLTVEAFDATLISSLTDDSPLKAEHGTPAQIERRLDDAVRRKDTARDAMQELRPGGAMSVWPVMQGGVYPWKL